MFRKLFFVLVAALAFEAGAEYNVRQPSEYLRPTFLAKDTAPGKWSLNVEDVFAKAKAAGKYTILFNTASWWCPFCETLEEMVLNSKDWKDYVASMGFYLAMLDFPYRGHVKDAEVWKSWHPELGDGWGFKCWLMNPEYLASIGLTEAQGLDAIMAEYEWQKKLALPSASEVSFLRWDTKELFTYRKLGYPTLIVFSPDGEELGRMSFPWHSPDSITTSEAREYVLQGLERIIHGECELCSDPTSGDPDVSVAQIYDGWLTDADGGMVGVITVKTSKYKSSKKSIRVSVTAVANGKKITFPISPAYVDGCLVCGDTATIKDFTLQKGDCSATLRLGQSGLSGELRTPSAVFKVTGARDISKVKDDWARRIMEGCPVGTWGLVVENKSKDPLPPLVRGYGALAVRMKKGGRASVSGTLGNGGKVGVPTKAILGENGLVCVPVRIDSNVRGGGLGFVIWFKDGKLLSIEQISQWVIDGANGLSLPVKVSATMSSGMGKVPDVLEMNIANFPETTTLGGCTLVEDHSFDEISVHGNRWVGTEITGFRAKCGSKTGLMSGTMVFRCVKSDGRKKNFTGRFSGVVMGGSGYGSVIVKGEGSWPVKIAVCGSCSE